MKKIILAFVVVMAFLSGTVFANAVNGLYNGHPIVNLVVEGQKVESDVPAFIMEGTTLVPIRVVTETLGMEVGWDQETYTVTITDPTTPQKDVMEPAKENTDETTSVRCSNIMHEYDLLIRDKVEELKLKGVADPYSHSEVKQIITERRDTLIKSGCSSPEWYD